MGALVAPGPLPRSPPAQARGLYRPNVPQFSELEAAGTLPLRAALK